MKTEDIPVDLVELGALRGAYGVKGWAKIAPFDADAVVLQQARRWWLIKRGHVPVALEVQAVKRHSAHVVVKWSGWETPEQVDIEKGAAVAVSRSEFPKLNDGEFYWVDVIGAQVVNRQDLVLGTVNGLRNNGAQDLLEVQGDGAVLLIPMVAEYIDAVDTERKRVTVDWQADWS